MKYADTLPFYQNIKTNANCPDAEKVGSGKGSCGGSDKKPKESKADKILREADEKAAELQKASQTIVSTMPKQENIKNELQSFFDQGNLGTSAKVIDDAIASMYNIKMTSILDRSVPRSVAERYASAMIKIQSAMHGLGNKREFGQSWENFYAKNPAEKQKNDQLDIARRYFEHHGTKANSEIYKKVTMAYHNR